MEASVDTVAWWMAWPKLCAWHEAVRAGLLVTECGVGVMLAPDAAVQSPREKTLARATFSSMQVDERRVRFNPTLNGRAVKQKLRPGKRSSTGLKKRLNGVKHIVQARINACAHTRTHELGLTNPKKLLPPTCSIGEFPIATAADLHVSITGAGTTPVLTPIATSTNTIDTSTATRRADRANCRTGRFFSSSPAPPFRCSAKGLRPSTRLTSSLYAVESMRRWRASSVASCEGRGEASWRLGCPRHWREKAVGDWPAEKNEGRGSDF